LLADPDHKTCDAFGTWVEKSMYGRKYFGIQRATFIIGGNGKIEHVWEKVSPADHAEEVLAFLNGGPSQNTTPVKKVTAAKAPAKKIATKNIPAKKAVVKKVPAKKTTAKKLTVKKTAAKKSRA
ncbi:MAG: hypothetical protein ABI644_12890, partial [Arenimonas sp.]